MIRGTGEAMHVRRPSMARMRATLLASLIASLFPLVNSDAVAQRYRGACSFSWDNQGYFISPFFNGNPRYDGRVTFARIKYSGSYECGGEGPGWSHDYPRTDVHFMRILREITTVQPFVERGPIVGSALVRLDEPELFSYPIAYLSEPGGWSVNDAELKGLRKYIDRGGLMIFDDIEGDPNPDYRNLVAQWQRAFPGAKPVRLTNEHPIFNCFF